MGISALQDISQGSCAFTKTEHDKANRSSKALLMMELFLIPSEIGCKDRKNPKMNATKGVLLFHWGVDTFTNFTTLPMVTG